MYMHTSHRVGKYVWSIEGTALRFTDDNDYLADNTSATDDQVALAGARKQTIYQPAPLRS
jgi:hypothetical protein